MVETASCRDEGAMPLRTADKPNIACIALLEQADILGVVKLAMSQEQLVLLKVRKMALYLLTNNSSK